jgi:hypothetical protein
MAKPDIVPVRSTKDMNRFLDLPARIYEAYPQWVPPLRSDERDLLTPGAHPFWERAERELFLALRDGRVVGRIAAIEDQSANAYQDARMCVWGFFECENDPEAAQALMEAAAAWGRSRGLTFLRGPMNPSTNYVIGMLLEGFEHAPAIMMPWTPPYYLDLMQACGMQKEKDLLAFYFDRSSAVPDWATKLADRMAERGEITVRSGNMSRLREEVRLLTEIYNDCWKSNWGFVPMSEAEADRMAKELKPIVKSEMAFFLYHKDIPVACGLVLPDFNPVLRRFKGKLGLASLVNLLLYRKEVKGCRALLFGVREEYKKLGIPLLALKYVVDYSKERLDIDWMEMSWTLEDNTDINDMLEDFGGKPYKRYRIWRGEI